jgi:hypothetical protein
MGDTIISIGNSLAWHRSWMLYYRPEGMPHWKILEFVVFGFGLRMTRLASKKILGMAPNGLHVEFYRNWKPAASQDNLVKREA